MKDNVNLILGLWKVIVRFSLYETKDDIDVEGNERESKYYEIGVTRKIGICAEIRVEFVTDEREGPFRNGLSRPTDRGRVVNPEFRLLW